MRIAEIAPLRVAVPPRDYGGTERCISTVTEAFVRMGHDVTLYASGDSQTTARLVAPVPTALTFDPAIDANAYHYAMLADIYRDAHHFDVLHAHMDYLPLQFAAMSATPTITTLHGRLDKAEFARTYLAYPEANFIAISNNQRAFLPHLHWVGVVHHSVDVSNFPFVATPENYLAFVGRISPEKGPDVAIEVAKRTGIPLKIAAKVDPADRDYFEQKIAPLLDHPLIEFIGPVDEARKREIISHALALVLPIDWPEPFGLVFIEALACGTPVITRPCGAVPEILEDGRTGYIRSTVDELAEAVLRVKKDIQRTVCRAYAQQRFDVPRMASDYLTIFERVRQQGRRFVMPHLDFANGYVAPEDLTEMASSVQKRSAGTSAKRAPMLWPTSPASAPVPPPITLATDEEAAQP